jgi:hypothetical protein
MLIVLTYKLGESIVEFAEKCDNNNERVMGIKKLVNDYGHPIPFYCLGCNKLLGFYFKTGSGRWDDKPSVLCCEKCGILSYHIYFHFLVLYIFSPASVSIFCSRV